MANDNYMTPAKYIPSIRNVLGTIDLDPFSSSIANERIKAKSFYDKVTNGFRHEWIGNVYANPPYSRGNLPRFSSYSLYEFHHLRTKQMIALLPNSTSEKWFQAFCKEEKSLCCLTDHRVKFTTFENGNFYENSSPDFGNAFIYLGPNKELFVAEFSKWGTIMKKF